MIGATLPILLATGFFDDDDDNTTAKGTCSIRGIQTSLGKAYESLGEANDALREANVELEEAGIIRDIYSREKVAEKLANSLVEGHMKGLSKSLPIE